MKKLYSLLIVLSFISSALQAQVYKDVAPIFYSRCTSCHHQNQHAPSFMNYSETYDHIALMENYLTIGKMPPWPPDTNYTRFLHERTISPSDKQALIDWLNAGALPGDTTLAPPPPVYPPYQLHG